MAERAWVFETGLHNGRRANGIKITCADCDATAFFAPNSGGRFPPNAAENRFTRDGWIVGKGPRADKCPACAQKAKEKFRIVQKDAPVQHAKKDSVTPKPREMTREDRRLIFLKIEEVYMDEKTGYSAGWTDRRVAEDMSIPLAWVVKIRDENFGPSGVNGEIAEFLEKSKPIIEEVRALSSGAADLVTEAQKKIDALSKLVPAVEELGRIGRRLERETLR